MILLLSLPVNSGRLIFTVFLCGFYDKDLDTGTIFLCNKTYVMNFVSCFLVDLYHYEL